MRFSRLLTLAAIIGVALFILLASAMVSTHGIANLGRAIAAETSGTPGDVDGDTVPDAVDNCPTTHNLDQSDDDRDGVGNPCDPTPRGGDPDGDGVGYLDDNCPNYSNPNQLDDDRDGRGNICDPTPRGEDTDGDGIPALDDRCPTTRGIEANSGCPASSGNGGNSGGNDGGGSGGDSGGNSGGSGGNSGGNSGGDSGGNDNGTGGGTGGDVSGSQLTVLEAYSKEGVMWLKLRSKQTIRADVRVQRKCTQTSKCRWKTIRRKNLIIKANKTRYVRVGRLKPATYRLRAYTNLVNQETGKETQISPVPTQS